MVLWKWFNVNSTRLFVVEWDVELIGKVLCRQALADEATGVVLSKPVVFNLFIFWKPGNIFQWSCTPLVAHENLMVIDLLLQADAWTTCRQAQWPSLSTSRELEKHCLKLTTPHGLPPKTWSQLHSYSTVNHLAYPTMTLNEILISWQLDFVVFVGPFQLNCAILV